MGRHVSPRSKDSPCQRQLGTKNMCGVEPHSIWIYANGSESFYGPIESSFGFLYYLLGDVVACK
jgi:hypothetical protein